jgi:hypothetical protein
MISLKTLFISSLGVAVVIGSAAFTAPNAAQAISAANGAQEVNVTNTEANPVPTRDVDNSARQTFQHQMDLTFINGQSRVSADMAVPAGKILVVEYVSGLSRFSSFFGSSIVDGEIGTFRGGQTVFHHFDFSDSRSGLTSIAGQSLRAYADGFGGIQILVEREGNQGQQDVRISVTGYLVDGQ